MLLTEQNRSDISESAERERVATIAPPFPPLCSSNDNAAISTRQGEPCVLKFNREKLHIFVWKRHLDVQIVSEK